mmetsp:Transcript_54182/g.89377  ORF Transcript_54182/g.89377 Transcript_54182/m.89377 type:complete len:84 (+) Transcript_54182:339-590(+)
MKAHLKYSVREMDFLGGIGDANEWHQGAATGVVSFKKRPKMSLALESCHGASLTNRRNKSWDGCVGRSGGGKMHSTRAHNARR